MSRCELTGKGPVIKNLVSHSNIKTKSVAQPNIQRKRLFSKSLNQMVRLYVAASTIRDMECCGGLDPLFLIKKKRIFQSAGLKFAIVSVARISKLSKVVQNG